MAYLVTFLTLSRIFEMMEANGMRRLGLTKSNNKFIPKYNITLSHKGNPSRFGYRQKCNRKINLKKNKK
jgi:hypothetical protein